MKRLTYYYYVVSPGLGLLIVLFIWITFPYWGFICIVVYSIILFFCLSRMVVYSLFLIGWSSYSKFRRLGGYRAVAQAISYEIRIIFILIGFCWFLGAYSFISFNYWQISLWFIIIRFPVLICWLLVSLAERNRSPFDFSEGESELVSGFNTEYGGGFFSLIFISEYASILFIRLITSVILLGFGFILPLKGFIIAYFYVWARASFPRLRYDRLIILSWKRVLPVTIGTIILIFIVRNYKTL